MSQPMVSVVMLMSAGREALAARALRAVAQQTYQHIELIAFDTSGGGKTIGYLRNMANRRANGELIAHFDDDDWSHPRRLEEQVTLLEASGKQCVGFRELLFWDTRGRTDTSQANWMGVGSLHGGEAWVYRNHQTNWAAGASLLYRRELWGAHPFDDAPHEDQRWMMTPAVSAECLGVDSTGPPAWTAPRMICEMHGGNTEQISRQEMIDNPDVWTRVPGFDADCERTMRL